MPIHSQIILDQNKQPSAQGLVLTGPILSVEIEVHPALAASLQKNNQPVPAPVIGQALIDTGATKTGIDQDVATKLALAPVGTIQSGTAGGQKKLSLYSVRLTFPGTNIPGLNLTQAAGCDLTGQGYIALIGRDFLSRFVMTYVGPMGQIILAH